MVGTLPAFQLWVGVVLMVLGIVFIIYRASLAEWARYAQGNAWRYGWWPLKPSLAFRMGIHRLDVVVRAVFLLLAGGALAAWGVFRMLQ